MQYNKYHFIYRLFVDSIESERQGLLRGFKNS